MLLLADQVAGKLGGGGVFEPAEIVVVNIDDGGRNRRRLQRRRLQAVQVEFYFEVPDSVKTAAASLVTTLAASGDRIVVTIGATDYSAAADSLASPSVRRPEFKVERGPCVVTQGGLCVGLAAYDSGSECDVAVTGSARLSWCPTFWTDPMYDHLVIANSTAFLEESEPRFCSEDMHGEFDWETGHSTTSCSAFQGWDNGNAPISPDNPNLPTPCPRGVRLTRESAVRNMAAMPAASGECFRPGLSQ